MKEDRTCQKWDVAWGGMEEEVKDHSLALLRVKMWFIEISNQGKV